MGSFECWIIMGSLLLARCFDLVEMSFLAYAAGELRVIDLVAAVLWLLCSTAPTSLIYATFDCFMIPRHVKAGFTLLYVAFYALNYVHYTRFRQWSSVQICYWTYCTAPRNVVLHCLGNLLLFIMKLSYGHLLGRRFHLLRTTYVEMNKTIALEALEHCWWHKIKRLCCCASEPSVDANDERKRIELANSLSSLRSGSTPQLSTMTNSTASLHGTRATALSFIDDGCVLQQPNAATAHVINMC